MQPRQLSSGKTKGLMNCSSIYVFLLSPKDTVSFFLRNKNLLLLLLLLLLLFCAQSIFFVGPSLSLKSAQKKSRNM